MAGFTLEVVLASCVGVSIRGWGDDVRDRSGTYNSRINPIPGRPQNYVHVELAEGDRSLIFVRPIDEGDHALVTRPMVVSFGERGSGPTPLIYYDTPGTEILFGPECGGHWLLVYRDAGAPPWLGTVCLPIFVRALTSIITPTVVL